MTKIWTKNEIINLLRTNDKAIGRALLRLNANQTYDEQTDKAVKYLNNKGFRPCHAKMGTSMAQWFESKGYLSERQAKYWRVTDKNGKMRIEIYVTQIMNEMSKV